MHLLRITPVPQRHLNAITQHKYFSSMSTYSSCMEQIFFTLVKMNKVLVLWNPVRSGQYMGNIPYRVKSLFVFLSFGQIRRTLWGQIPIETFKNSDKIRRKQGCSSLHLGSNPYKSDKRIWVYPFPLLRQLMH